MTTSTGATGWSGDPGIPWRILLTAQIPARPTDEVVLQSLRALADEQGWSAPPPVLVHADVGLLRARLAEAQPAPVVLGRSGDHLIISAHHSAVDGLGLLRVLDGLGFGPASSSARGVGDRPDHGGPGSAIARRLGEAAFAPPARLTLDPPRSRPAGDVMVERSLPRTCRTADLVHAAGAAVVARESARGHRARHIAIAVGASSDPAPDSPLIRDRSALVRLRDVEDLDRAAVAQALRAAPLEPPPPTGGGGRGGAFIGRAAGVGMRVLAPRLGSTLLVSHLGEVEAPRIDRLSFHPVTAGGTGLSLGAVGHRGVTTLTLRGRAAQWNDDGLEQLLEAVISLL